MSASVVSTFVVDHQSGQSISNIGGDQTIYYGGGGRAAVVGRILAVGGLVLWLAGVALLGLTGVGTVRHLLHAAGPIHGPYTQYLPSVWPVPLGLLAGGIVVTRVARIVVGR